MSLKSPCVEKCDLNPDNDICTGCLRTSREISDWTGYTNEEKKEVLKLIEIRKNV